MAHTKIKKRVHTKYHEVKKRVSKHIDDAVRLQKTPHELAIGFAIGTFIALLPLPGLHVLVGLLIVILFKKVNKFTLFAAIAIFNPFIVTAPILLASNELGKIFVPKLHPGDPGYFFIHKILDTTLRIFVGSVIISFVTSIISYFISKPVAAALLKKYGQKQNALLPQEAPPEQEKYKKAA